MTTDQRIRDDIEAALEWEPRTDVGRIAVSVRDGIATLSGTVHHFGQKFDAERIACHTKGVRGVANEIEVASTTIDGPTDADVAAAAADALAWRYSIPDDAITVVVKNGWITLHGEVPWSYQRRDAEDAVRNLIGVKTVTNEIVVTRRPNAQDVHQRITDALTRAATLDANSISVSVDDDVVTLRGRVRTWQERDDAARTAALAPGIATVHNRIIVAA